MEDLLGATSTPSNLEMEPEDFGSGSLISGAEVITVVKKILSGKSPEVVEIHTGFLKALDVVGLLVNTALQSSVNIRVQIP